MKELCGNFFFFPFFFFELWLNIRSAILNFQLEKICYSHYIRLGLFFLMFAGTYIYVCVCMCVCACARACVCMYV